MNFKKAFEKIFASSSKGQIQIQFDPRKREYSLSTPVFSSKKLPQKIKTYVEARKNFHFRPHATSFRIEGESVVLVQKLPYSLDFQSRCRSEIDQFCTLSRSCYETLFAICKEI